MHNLLQVMYADGFLSSEEVVALRRTCHELHETPVRVLRSLEIASPSQIQFYLNRYFGVSLLQQEALSSLDASYASLLPVDLAWFFSCFPVGEEKETLYVAMEDPLHKSCIAQLSFFLNRKISAVSATVFQIADALGQIYGLAHSALRLTTLIEKSRGVEAGFRYLESRSSLSQSENLSARESKDQEDSSPAMEERDEQSHILLKTPFLPEEEKDQLDGEEREVSEPDPLKPFFGENRLLGEGDVAEEGWSAPLFLHSSQEDESSLSAAPLLSPVHVMLSGLLAVRLALIQDQERAVSVANSILSTHGVRLSLEAGGNFRLEGKDFVYKASLMSSLPPNLPHPLIVAALPAVRKLSSLQSHNTSKKSA